MTPPVSGNPTRRGFFFMADRAVVFIDGNNWFHSLQSIDVDDRGRLNYKRITEKLLGPRTWLGTRYYIGRMTQALSPGLYAQQRMFLAQLERTDQRMSVHLGRLETRSVENAAATELRHYLATLKVRIDSGVFADLMAIAKKHSSATVMVEKAVDVMLSLDLVTMALHNAYDAAYLLSADGDFTPAVEAARALGKRVYAASPTRGAQLARAVNTFIHLPKPWFADCYGG